MTVPWKLSRNPLSRDVAFIAAAVLTAGALIGAAVVCVDVLIHRHRR